MASLAVINVIPNSLSGEVNDDSESSLAVNPQRQMAIAVTRTPDPAGGPNAPIFVSSDAGRTWSVRTVIPGGGSTSDVTVGFADGGTLYAAALFPSATPNQYTMSILRSTSYDSNTLMTVLRSRSRVDQPWVVARTGQVAGGPQDRLFVGNNDVGISTGRTAAVDEAQDAAAASPSFRERGLERRATAGQDGPPIRIAAHADGTVYAAFLRWSRKLLQNVTFDVVVVRDDQWAGDVDAFFDLVDSADQVVGARVATDLYASFNDILGQERLGADLALAVDPTNSSIVWLAWCSREGGPGSSDWTMRIARSDSRGQHWRLVRFVETAKNPALAVNSEGLLGLAYQQLSGGRWITKLELTADGFSTQATAYVLHQADATNPPASGLPYLGDYIHLHSVGLEFFGAFSGDNTPIAANFPNGVKFQRNVDWASGQLRNLDGISAVPNSIDPYFFHWAPGQFVLPNGLHLTSWEAAAGDTAKGQLAGGVGVTVTGPLGTGTVVDGTFPLYDSDAFTPRLPHSDTVNIVGSPGSRFIVSFSQPVLNPVLFLASFGCIMTLPTGTEVNRISGDGGFNVAANTVSGTAMNSNDSNGTIQLMGTFTSIPFSLEPNYVGGSQMDGIYLHVAGFQPVE